MTNSKRNPAGQGRGSQKACRSKPNCGFNSTTVSPSGEVPESRHSVTEWHLSEKQPGQVRSEIGAACLGAIANEITIVLWAADRLAAGYGLGWQTYDRLHQAHQRLLTVLAAVRGEEVPQ